MKNRRILATAALLLVLALLSSCAPGDERFTVGDPAGFWWGIWHGLIAPITLVVHVFNDAVRVYEIDNSGGWYDFGFLFGLLTLWGGGSHGGRTMRRKKTPEQLRNEAEWEEVARKVEAKIKRKMREWAEAEPDEDWDEVEKKIEKKTREVVKDWAEKD